MSLRKTFVVGSLGALLAAGAVAGEGDPTRILDFELKFLAKAAEKHGFPADGVAKAKAIFEKHDAIRREQLKTLAETLKELETTQAAGPEDAAKLEPLVAELVAARKSCVAAHQAKRQELEGLLSDKAKLKLMSRFLDREGPGKGERFAWIAKKLARGFMLHIAGLGEAKADELIAYVEAKKAEREALRTEWNQVRTEVKAIAASDPDDAQAAVAIARLKAFREKVKAHVEAGIAGAEAKLSIPERAKLASALYRTAKSIGGLFFKARAIEEVRWFL